MTSLTAEAFDVAIIGGGIVGAAIAFHLAPQARVLLLEAESAAGVHATGRSAALYAPSYGPPAVRALTRASRGFYLAPPAGFADVPLLTPRGALFVGPAEQRALADALRAALVAEGLSATLLDAAAAQARVPMLRPEACASGVFDDSALDIDVDALLHGFLRGARAAGAQWRPKAQVQALERSGTAWEIETTAGPVRAATVVNAAGAWADAVGDLAGAASIGLEPRRRTAFTFDPPQAVDCRVWPAVIALDESWYIKPDAGLLLGSPANADPTHPHDVVPEEFDVALGIHRIESATTLSIRRPRSTWAGLRSFVTDGEPVLGFDPQVPGFFWAAALGGYGIQSAPATGRLCAALLVGRGLPDDLAAAGLNLAQVSPQRLRRPAG
jgi:D-arginine dehydrogenase